MRGSRIVLSVLIAVLVPAGTSAAVHRDLDYGSTAAEGLERRRLDIHTPDKVASDRPLPVVVYVHGGGWSRGDKSRIGRKPDWLTARGFLLVSVNYRLLPDGRHPRNGEDLAAALAWIHGNIADYGGDPRAIFLLGHSSGAHLISLVATDERFLAAHGHTRGLVAGVISLDCSALDLETRILTLPPEQRGLYVATFGGHPVGWRDASPRVHAAAGKTSPPFLLLVAGDGGPTHHQAAAFAESLEGAGANVTLEVFPDQTHGSINAHLGRRDHEPTAAVERFLDSLSKR
jgi:acetyl esterase/lipase